MITSTKETQDLKNAASNIKDDARDTLYDVKGDFRAAANRTGRRVRHLIDQASDELHHAGDSVSSHIHEKPMQSSMIALGVGFILGALFRRF